MAQNDNKKGKKAGKSIMMAVAIPLIVVLIVYFLL